MKTYPAIEVRTPDSDGLLALVDNYAPTAVEDRGDAVRVFFATAAARDAALDAVASAHAAIAVDVDDEDWARRSQENLQPITVGRITIAPTREHVPSPQPRALSIVILPSMGFGTGHHATTRLCLAALQELELTGAEVLDVGTGSGVLAIAASRLGAARALGIDVDPDAIESARENLTLNPDARGVAFEVVDLAAAPLPEADVITANLTGALLVRTAPQLLRAVRGGGTLVVSGVLASERNAVHAALTTGASVVWERCEDEWVGFAVKKS